MLNAIDMEARLSPGLLMKRCILKIIKGVDVLQVADNIGKEEGSRYARKGIVLARIADLSV
jgi:hypothetical protein